MDNDFKILFILKTKENTVVYFVEEVLLSSIALVI